MNASISPKESRRQGVTCSFSRVTFANNTALVDAARDIRATHGPWTGDFTVAGPATSTVSCRQRTVRPPAGAPLANDLRGARRYCGSVHSARFAGKMGVRAASIVSCVLITTICRVTHAPMTTAFARLDLRTRYPHPPHPPFLSRPPFNTP